MSHTGLRRAALLCCALATLLATGAQAALVETGDIVLRADGAFEPRSLPRQRFAPIEFEGHLDIAAKGGGEPSALQKVVVGFDRDGRLSAGGLPSCEPAAIAEASVAEARRTCRGAIVGRGHLDALIALPGGPVRASSPLTLFNGPPQDGRPTVVLHAQTTAPGVQTYAILVPIERRRGEFRYRTTVEVPPIAGGLGALTHVDVRIGRRFEVEGAPRSYASARCSDGILRTFGGFTFADGTIIEGSVEKFCRAR